jgi:hypothetical protein
MTKKGHLVYIRKANKNGDIESKPYWVDGDKVYEIEKQDPETGEWKQPVAPDEAKDAQK